MTSVYIEKRFIAPVVLPFFRVDIAGHVIYTRKAHRAHQRDESGIDGARYHFRQHGYVCWEADR